MDRAETSNIVAQWDKVSEYVEEVWECFVLMEISALKSPDLPKDLMASICQRWADVGIFYLAKRGKLMCQPDEWGGIVPRGVEDND